MRNPRMLTFGMAAVLAVAVSAAAFAQATDTQAGANGTTAAQGVLDKNGAAAQTDAHADAHAKAEAKMKTILARGAKTSSKTRAAAEQKIESSVKEVDAKATSDGDAQVAERLAGEFGMTADALTTEKQSLDASWGELMIAHTLAANSTSGLTADQIVAAKKDGSGWGQIAAGMGFKLGELVSAMQAESRVALGLAKSDGKVPSLHANAAANAAHGAGVRAAGLNTDAGVKTDVGVHVRAGKP